MIKSNCGFQYTSSPDGLLVALTGEIDHHGATDLRRSVDDLVWKETPSHLILDMSGIDFMDSSGLGFIMGRYALMRGIGGTLTLRDPSPTVMRMLSLTGFDKKVRIVNTHR